MRAIPEPRQEEFTGREPLSRQLGTDTADNPLRNAHNPMIGTPALPSGLLSTAEDAQVCPRDYRILRVSWRLLDNSWLLPMLCVCAIVPGIIGVTCPNHYGTLADCDSTQSRQQGAVGDSTPLRVMQVGLQSLCFCSLLGVLPGLRRILCPGGVLDQLGAGTKMILSMPDCSGPGQRLLYVMRGYDMDVWAKFLTVSAVVEAMIYFFGPLGMTTFIPAVSNGWWLSAIYKVGNFTEMSVAPPLAIGWWLTLKMAAALAKYEIRTVRINIQRCTAGTAEWIAEVQEPTLTLVTETMPALSNAFASGASAICLVCWMNTFIAIIDILIAFDDGEVVIIPFGMAFLMSCLPAAVLWDLADASTECDLLVKSLNDKRVSDPSTTTHLELYKLEVMLGQLNKNQGLGFVMVTKVIDKATFFKFFIQLGTAVVTAITSMLALVPPQPETPLMCDLTKADEAAFAMTASLINATCTYNLTVGPNGVLSYPMKVTIGGGN